MYSIDLPSPSIIQRVTTIDKAINKVRKIRAENQVANALNTRNRPFVNLINNFPLNFDIMVW